MVKKLALFGFYIFGLLLASWAQEGPAAIEYLARATTVRSIAFEYRPDPTIKTSFESQVLLRFDVPPSPKSPAVFFDVYGQFIVGWTKREKILASGASLVATDCPGCVFQLKANLKKEGKKFRVVHTAQLCAEAAEKNPD